MKTSRTIFLLSAACLAPTAALSQSNGWRHTDTAQAAGVEMLPGGAQRTFRAATANGLLAYQTTHGFDGALDTLSRREVVNAQGIFTWLDAAPDWNLLLPEASLPQMTRLFLPIHASPADLRGGPFALARQFGQDIRDGGQTVLCGRPCRILTVSTGARAGVRTSQRLWVDLETGLLLRRDEDSGGSALPSYALREFVPNAPLEANAFQIPANAKTIRGLVNAGILLHTADTRDANAELERVRKTSRLQQGNWIKALPVPPGFTYAQTLLQEDGTPGPLDNALLALRDLSSLTWYSGALLNADSRLADTSLMFDSGALVNTSNMTVTLQAAAPSVDASMERAETADRAAEAAAPGSQARADAEKEADAARNAAAQSQWQSADAPAVLDLVRLPYMHTTEPTGLSWDYNPANQSAFNGRALFNQAGDILNPANVPPSDFKARAETDLLDRATGDTISLFQLRNRDWRPLLHGFKTMPGTRPVSPIHGQIETFEATMPCTLHGIVWHEGSCDFLLTSTRLDIRALIALADTIPNTPLTAYGFGARY